jgi:hypothetical protein
MATILTLLIVPVYILWRLSHETASEGLIGEIIGVLLSFTLLFSAVLSHFTRAKRQEILASAAAYVQCPSKTDVEMLKKSFQILCCARGLRWKCWTIVSHRY